MLNDMKYAILYIVKDGDVMEIIGSKLHILLLRFKLVTIKIEAHHAA
jgi:hypothetical protein